MAVIEDELQRLWQLLAELSSQLTQNREQSELLKKQAEDLKTQAIHTGTGYALKRFNVDLSQEQFESELERMNAQLVIENQTLQHENRQLAILLKDHENTLEQIMARFRSHAHSTQQHELELVKYYESMIQSILEKQNQRSPNETHHLSELDPDSFQIIQSISSLIQKAMRELSGEEPETNEIDDIDHQQAELDSSDFSIHPATSGPEQLNESGLSSNVRFEDPFKPHQTTDGGLNLNMGGKAAEEITNNPRRKSTSVIDYRPRMRDPSSGGYIGKRKGSLSDYALLSAIELESLRRENDYLREMLGIAQDYSLESTPGSTTGSTYSSKFENIQDESEFSSNNIHNTKVVNQVIKEEEEEDDDDDDVDHPPPPLTEDQSDPNHHLNHTFQINDSNPHWPQNLKTEDL